MGFTDESLSAAGRAVQQQLWGENVGGKSPGTKVAPEFFEMVRQYCFGMFWTRDTLSIKDRSLVTVAQTAALGRFEQFQGHLKAAMNVGWTREELIEVLMHTAVYCGLPTGVSALNAAAEVLAEPD